MASKLAAHYSRFRVSERLLLTGDPNRMSIDLPKSGVVGIETALIEGGSGTLRFFFRPKLL